MKIESKLIVGFFIAIFIAVVSTAIFISSLNIDYFFRNSLAKTDRVIDNIELTSHYLNEEEMIFYLDNLSSSEQFNVTFYNSEGQLVYHSQNTPTQGYHDALVRAILSSNVAGERYYINEADFEKNTVGVPLVVSGKTYAMFIRRSLEQETDSIVQMGIYALLSLIISGLITFGIIAEWIVKPIKRLIKATEKIATGDFDAMVPIGNRKDEMRMLNIQFNTMVEGLVSLESKRQQFVSDVSHEFQTPITSILGFAKIIREDELEEAQKQKYLDIIIHQSERLSMLSKTMLQLTKLEDGTYLAFELFNLTHLVEEVCDAFAMQLQEKSLTLERKLEPLDYFGDQKQLEQVINNIISNAIKYSHQGGMIHVSLKKTKKEVIFSVEDHGIGMPANATHRIFERFYRIEAARSEQGSGLGLAITKKVVEMHHGYIKIQSVEHVGSTFSVVLPRLHK